jgi:hypothetical protein
MGLPRIWFRFLYSSDSLRIKRKPGVRRTLRWEPMTVQGFLGRYLLDYRYGSRQDFRTLSQRQTSLWPGSAATVGSSLDVGRVKLKDCVQTQNTFSGP